LSGFMSVQGRELPALAAARVGDLLQQRHTIAPRTRAPRRKCRLRGGNRIAHLLAAGALKLAEQDARVDRAAIVELARGADFASADHQRIAPAERRLDALDGGAELAVASLHA